MVTLHIGLDQDRCFGSKGHLSQIFVLWVHAGGRAEGFGSANFSKLLDAGNIVFLLRIIKLETVLTLPGCYIFKLCLQ